MHAASRGSSAALSQRPDAAIGGNNVVVAQAAQTGSELFNIVEVLDSDRGLRVAVADISTITEQRSDPVRSLFAGKIFETTLNLAVDTATQIQSIPREVREDLVELDHQTPFHSAEDQGQLKTVESELLQLGHILTEQSQFEQLLVDRTAIPEAKCGLPASVLYGKVASAIETLTLQAVGRPSKRPANDIDSLSRLAAGLRNHVIVRVTSTTIVSNEQERALVDKLGQVYGRAISIYTVVDESTLGGLVIRVGDEAVDGNLSTKLKKLRIDLD